MEPGWQRYVESIDAKVERLEHKVEQGFNGVNVKMDKLMEFKWQIVGGSLVVAFLIQIISSMMAK